MSVVTDDDVLPYLQTRLPDFTPEGEPTRLPDGNLNVVWRAHGRDRSVIVKYAPPYIAADPKTPLDPNRLLIEADCLRALAPTGVLSGVPEPEMRAPHPLDVDEAEHVLIMEDVGEIPTLGRWVREADRSGSGSVASIVGTRLGAFVGRLHGSTLEGEVLANRFDNRSMQETRRAVQYNAVEQMLRRGGVPDASALGERARALGERLLELGRCLTMGDLWPPSVLVDGREVRLIDWELAHFGRPLQDVAHWMAHLWMQQHRAPSGVTSTIEQLRHSFLSSYRRALGDRGAGLWTDREKRDAAIHYGAEILVRAVGPFQDGYVYEGMSPTADAVTEAVSRAAQFLRHPGEVDIVMAGEQPLPDP